MSSLGSQTVSHVTLSVPQFGAWRADCVLTGGAPPTGQVVLTVGDLALQGTVLRSGLDAPGRPHAIVVGAPGWERELTRPLSYFATPGVQLTTVLKDLATLAAEPIVFPPQRTLEPHYATHASSHGERVKLRDELSSLRRLGVLEGWRVDPDGITRFGARVGSEVTARATRLRSSNDVGLTVYGIDAPASFLPGNILEGLPIVRLVVNETAGKLEAAVWQ